MTRKVTKNIAAVPKSLIIARAPRQNIESPTNSVRFFLVKSSFRVAAPAYIKAIFTNSEGCIVVKPRSIQFCAPYCELPKTRFTSSSRTAAPIINMRMPFALFKSRRYQHRARNIISPSSIAMSCLSTDSGAAEAVTARLRVERKNAISSISKPTLRSERINRKYAHITTHSPSIHSGSAEGQSSPSEMTSCSAVSI